VSLDLTTRLATLEGFRSKEVARFLWQMDEQSRRLTADTRGLEPADLEWQSAPGMNSIGMLLAHIAVSEVHLAQVGLLAEKDGHPRDVIGIGEEEEGLPLAAGAPASPALAGRPLEWFDDLLARARAHTKQVTRNLVDAELDVDVVRPRPNGGRRVFNKGWVLYHLLEHQAGHHAQINLLRHLRTLARG
jgi:DinB superfamily